ncbi:eCIS core domain-containing protein [Streptomyces wedmorensis]
MRHDHAPDPASSGRRPERPRPPGRAPGPAERPDLAEIQRLAGNAAVVQLLKDSGHTWAQEEHRHGAGCGHGTAEQPAVQRSAVHDVLRSGGRALDEATRTDMEARLGADFSDVRIHDDSAARASAAEVGARAYTSGSHVVIGDGGADKHTLAHELTHVVQQRQGPVAGTDNGAGLKVSDPSDRFEREAEANARRVMSSPPAEAPLQRAAAGRPGGGVSVQRAGGGRKNNGEGSSNGGSKKGGGKAQGDHVFNSLDDAANGIATELANALTTYSQTLDTDTTTALRASQQLWSQWTTLRTAQRDAMTALAAAAAAAHEYGHPAKGSPYSSFIATLPEHSTVGSDANSDIYGQFSRDLNGLAGSCAAQAWSIPQEMTTAAAATEWPPYLAARIYDPDAAHKVRERRLTRAGDKRNFDIWRTEAQRLYLTLFRAIITALNATRAAIEFLRTQNNAQQPQDPAQEDGS